MFVSSYWGCWRLRGFPRGRLLRVSRSIPADWEDMQIEACEEVYPSWGCIMEWKRSDKGAEAWKRYEARYWRETLSKVDVHEFVKRYNNGMRILVCYEKDVTHCHRGTLGRWLRWGGYEYKGEIM